MENIQKEITKYISNLLLPLVPRGIELACDPSPEGISIAVIPKSEKDYRILLGPRGENCIAMRRLVKVWVRQNCAHINIHVFVPNSKMIK